MLLLQRPEVVSLEASCFFMPPRFEFVRLLLNDPRDLQTSVVLAVAANPPGG